MLGHPGKPQAYLLGNKEALALPAIYPTMESWTAWWIRTATSSSINESVRMTFDFFFMLLAETHTHTHLKDVSQMPRPRLALFFKKGLARKQEPWSLVAASPWVLRQILSPPLWNQVLGLNDLWSPSISEILFCDHSVLFNNHYWAPCARHFLDPGEWLIDSTI